MSDQPTAKKAKTDPGVKWKPDGYHTLTPYITVPNAAEAIDFYKKAFDATEVMRMPGPNSTIVHAEIQIGDSKVMMSDPFPDMNAHPPSHFKGSPCSLCMYVEDCDAVYSTAIAAGAKSIRECKDQFYGDRTGTVEDPFGHHWHIQTHTKEMSVEECQEKSKEIREKSDTIPIRKTTCADLAGPSDCMYEVTGATADEMAKKCQDHCKEMFASKDESHLKAAESMKEKGPQDMMNFFTDFKARFDSLPTV